MEITTYIGIGLLAMVKYFIGVVTAIAGGLNLGEILLTAGLGGIVSSVGYTYFGKAIKQWYDRTLGKKRKPKSFARRRRIVRFWKTYGLAGTALLIPILSPQISIGIAISFGEKPARIVSYISISIIFWIVVCYLFKGAVLQLTGV